MDVQAKAVLCIVPFIVAGCIGGFLAYPAYSDYASKTQQVESKKSEQSDLTAKLKENKKLKAEKDQLDNDIEALRGAVPRKPQIEILNMDLEKMCNEAGVDLVSFAAPEKESLKKLGLDDSKKDTTATTPKGKKGAAGAAGAAAAAAASAASAATKLDISEVGLSRVSMQVKCLGDYSSIQKLIKDLETYKRVVALSQFKVYVPRSGKSAEKGEKGEGEKATGSELPDEGESAEGDAQGDYHKLWCSFVVTAYYLP
jgi:Tfp pilus assembly protein PilO